jgi:hypothetical protein
VTFDFLAAAFSGGAFARLETLDLQRIADTSTAFFSFLDALTGNTCASTLKILSIYGCDIDDELMARLGDLVVSGAFPLLEAFGVKANGIKHTSDTFFEAVKAASCPLRLTTLYFSQAQVDDEQLEVLLSAIEMGRLPLLKRLLLEDNYITDRGLVALSQTIKGGHLSNLIEIFVSARRAGERKMRRPRHRGYKEGAVLLAAAASSHCPKLVCFKLAGVNNDINREVYTIFSKRKDVRVKLIDHCE